MVQEHDQRLRERLNQCIANWVEEVHSVTTSWWCIAEGVGLEQPGEFGGLVVSI